MAVWQGILTVSERTGAWLLVAVAVLFTVDVVFRYAAGITYTWIIDLEWYLTSCAVCLGLASTLRVDQHVRVDVFRERQSSSMKTWTDRIGHTLLLLPWCAFVVYAGARYAYNSWVIGEGSADPGGLPARYLPKMMLVLGFVLLGIEAVRQILRATDNSS